MTNNNNFEDFQSSDSSVEQSSTPAVEITESENASLKDTSDQIDDDSEFASTQDMNDFSGTGMWGEQALNSPMTDTGRAAMNDYFGKGNVFQSAQLDIRRTAGSLTV